MAVDGRAPRHAVTHFVLAEALARTSLLEVRLETGRTHQIRVHLAAIGHPVVGDRVVRARWQRARTHTPVPARRTPRVRASDHRSAHRARLAAAPATSWRRSSSRARSSNRASGARRASPGRTTPAGLPQAGCLPGGMTPGPPRADHSGHGEDSRMWASARTGSRMRACTVPRSVGRKCRRDGRAADASRDHQCHATRAGSRHAARPGGRGALRGSPHRSDRRPAP